MALAFFADWAVRLFVTHLPAGPGWNVSRTAPPAACQSSGPHQQQHQRQPLQQQVAQTERHLERQQQTQRGPLVQQQGQQALGQQAQQVWSRPQQQRRQGRHGLLVGQADLPVVGTGLQVPLLALQAYLLAQGALEVGPQQQQGDLVVSLPSNQAMVLALALALVRPAAAERGAGTGQAPGEEMGSGGVAALQLLLQGTSQQLAFQQASGRAMEQQQCQRQASCGRCLSGILLRLWLLSPTRRCSTLGSNQQWIRHRRKHLQPPAWSQWCLRSSQRSQRLSRQYCLRLLAWDPMRHQSRRRQQQRQQWQPPLLLPCTCPL